MIWQTIMYNKLQKVDTVGKLLTAVAIVCTASVLIGANLLFWHHVLETIGW